MLTPPRLKLFQPATARAAPSRDRLGPSPNSHPLLARTPTKNVTLGTSAPCSTPPRRMVSSTTSVGPPLKEKTTCLDCHPNCVMTELSFLPVSRFGGR